MTSQPPKFRVAVCGGGIGGIVTAYALGKLKDIEVEVYEAASEFAEVGVAFGMSGRLWGVLRELGLEEALLKYTPSAPTANEIELGVNFATGSMPGGFAPFLRSDFHGAVIKELSPSVRTFTSKRLVSYTESSSSSLITLTFTDGSTATCDILIGADGVKSAVRGCMLEGLARKAEENDDIQKAGDLRGLVKAKWSGVMVYRVLVPAERLAQIDPEHPALKRPVQYLGKNRHTVSYPVAQGKIVNLAIFEADYTQEGILYPEPWVEPQMNTKSILEAFKDWDPNARHLVGAIEGLNVNKWAVNVVSGLPSFSSSRVALLGDAAHSMTPFLGAGAGQAIEDAYVLSALLSSPLTTRATIPAALEIYSRIRTPIAYHVFERSRQSGRYCDFYDPENPSLESGAWDLEQLAEDLRENREWHLGVPHPKEEMTNALALLGQECEKLA